MRGRWIHGGGALLALVAATNIGGCANDDVAEAGTGEVGTVSLALGAVQGAFFRLRIFKAPPDQALSGKALFDTGCIQRQSTTFELTNIPVGTGLALAYEGFDAATCAADARNELGYRGAMTIKKGTAPYYHVPVYPEHGSVALPEDLNLSASVATAIDFCDEDADCPGARDICYDAAKPEYWCVPACESDADCTGIHPRATCELSSHWCKLASPYPLNLSEPRALGAAATLPDGSALFVGGLRDREGGGLGPTAHYLEKFDAGTGLFAPVDIAGLEAAPAGWFGFARLGDDRVVVVGGVSGFDDARWIPNDEGFTGTATWSSVVQASATVIDIGDAHAQMTALTKAVAKPTVVALADGGFFVAGGLVVEGTKLVPTDATEVCTVGADFVATCTAGPTLAVKRYAAAPACLDANCRKIALVGGAVAGALVEVVDLDAGTATAATSNGGPARIFDPAMCGLLVVGGSTEPWRPMPFAPIALQIDGATVAVSALTGTGDVGWLAAAESDNCQLYAGGLDGQAAGMTALRLANRGAAPSFDDAGATLTTARFGAVAVRLGSGPLAGAHIIAGGLALPSGEGPVSVVRGAEVWRP